jgi:hypothetical protein
LKKRGFVIMIRYHKIVAGLCVLLFLLSAGCLENGDGKENVLTLGELHHDYNQETDLEKYILREYFSSYDDGDTIIIRDTINDIRYREETNDTGIEFISLLGEKFSIKGDITDEFRKGDDVEIKLHIISVRYTKQDTNTGEIWTFNRETLQEGWDSKNNTFIPIPQGYIHHASYENKKRVMTFQGFIDGYNQTYSNESKKIISDFLYLDAGDTLLIWDTLHNITYGDANGYTSIGFVSMPGTSFRIQGDITDDYQIGDNVEIELHIIKATFTDVNPYTNEIWTYEIETFKEIWDNENRIYIPLPNEYIRHR